MHIIEARDALRKNNFNVAAFKYTAHESLQFLSVLFVRAKYICP